MNLWELMSSGSSANARKNSATNQPRYVSAEEFNAIPSPKEQWNNNSLYKSNVAPQINPADMSGFQSNVTGAGDFSNGLYNNNRMSVQNPLSATSSPVNIDSASKTVIGADSGSNTKGNNSVSIKDLYSNIDTSNLSNTSSQDTTPPSVSDQFRQDNYNVPDIGVNGETGSDFNFDKVANYGSNGLWDSVSDFSSKDAAKNSLGNIATGVNVGSSLFNAYSTYQSNKAKADYQNRIAGLYEKQYKDTEARRANAQANYDASVPK